MRDEGGYGILPFYLHVVCLVYPVSPVQPNTRDKPHELEQLVRSAGSHASQVSRAMSAVCVSILPARCGGRVSD